MYLNSIDRARPQKLYYQLLEILKEHIQKGDWKVGAKIPTEEQLSFQYNVSKATVRLAISELASLGYLKKFQGKGTYVRRRKPEQNILMMATLGEDWLDCDSPCLIRLIEKKIQQPDNGAGDCLGLFEDYCFYMSRAIIANGFPSMIQKFYIPRVLTPDFIASEDLTDTSIYSLLENKCGVTILRVKETIDVSEINSDDASLMELEPGKPVLRVRHVCYAQGDSPAGLSESLYRTDVHIKTSEFERLRI
ncbi:MAG: GntR family transcriptional regulator [Nitrospirae bacterium]|nr:GntR family transcriptional regulator [Nitrospirota bacterium]